MTYFNKRYHPPGTPPGTLAGPDNGQVHTLNLRLIDYTDTEFAELAPQTLEECRAYLESPTQTWIHFQGTMPTDILRELGQMFALHPLAMEDVINTGQRPKLEAYEDQLFVVMTMPVMHETDIVSEQVSFFLGSNYIISFHNGATDHFDAVRNRLRKHSGKIRQRKTDYLLYALLDIVIDQGFPVLEMLGDKIETLEEQLLEAPDRTTLHQLHALKRELLLLRRQLWPQREVLNSLIRSEYGLIEQETTLYLRDCYDHIIHIMDLLETYRDMTSSMLDVYLSSASNKLNDVMRVLTVIATIFLPLTFIVGVYGMNFRGNSDSPWAMPELTWHYGYPIIWGIMIAVGLGMIAYFRRKKWI